MKKLSEICKRLRVCETNVSIDYDVTGITTDSRTVEKGNVFVVTEGNEKYVKDAFNRGAVCVIAEKAYEEPCVKIESLREGLSLACSDFYDNPEKKLKIIGVVGTNGKTSVTHILNEIFKPYKKTAVIGTLGMFVGDEKIDNPMTTPDPPVLYKVLAKAAEAGVEYVFCEITAHAIFFEKMYGLRCEICVFTNVSRDHLDFFKDMDNYAKIKRSFFCKQNVKIGVINADDENGRKILKESNICSVSYGIDEPSDVFAIDINNEGGLKFIANAFDDIIYASTRFEGKFNVYNILAAISVARLVGLSPRDIQTRLMMMPSIEGRAESISDRPKVVIDFAHTPDGLSNVLRSLKETAKGRVIAVFGCGGNRDKGKRPIMAKIGTDEADFCVFTSDNPRFENPTDIISDMLSGLDEEDLAEHKFVVIENRTEAIDFALNYATDDDCVVVCGKGGEDYMDIKGKKYPYSDKSVCLAALENRNCRR